MKVCDLRAHGFLSINLKEDMTNLCDVLPSATEILTVDRKQAFSGEMWYFLNVGAGKLVGYTMGQFMEEGTFGKIFRAKRMVLTIRPDNKFNIDTQPHEVVVKQVIGEQGWGLTGEDLTSHASEALLHVLSWKMVQDSLTPWAIPRPYEIYGEKGNPWSMLAFGMSFVEGETLHDLLAKKWVPSMREENTKLFREILAQTAYILHRLQNKLCLNHRDLKVNNIMVRSRADPLTLTLDGIKVVTSMEVTLIDFGFACVGCNRGPTLFQAGTWFPFTDVCYKKGRDLAQLIYCINCYFPLKYFLTADMYGAVQGIMRIAWSGGVTGGLEGFTKDGLPCSSTSSYDTGIYEFLRREEVDPVSCEPAKVFAVMA